MLRGNLKEIEASDIHQRLGPQKGKYILLSAHREEHIDTEKNRRTKQAQSQTAPELVEGCLSYALQGGGNAKRNFLSLMAA